MTTGQTTPKNAQQANRHANCYTKAQGMEAAGYRAVKVCQDRYDIYGPGNFVMADYTVYLYDSTCDCPDWQKHRDGVCKHTCFAQIVKAGEEGEIAALEEQCRLYDECEGYLDKIPTPTLESLAAKSLYQKMSADLQRVEMAVLTHGTRRVNPVQCQQDRSRAAALQVAVHVVSEYR